MPMNMENELLIMDEPIDFEENQFKFKTFWKTIAPFKGIYKI
jgi:hypothetical protein